MYFRTAPHTAGYLLVEAKEAFAQGRESSSRIVPLAEGRNSLAYIVGDETIIKVGRRALSEEQATRKLAAAKNFYDLLRKYHGSSVVDTSFRLGADLIDRTKLRLMSGQPFVEGTPLTRASKYDPKLLDKLFTDALTMYWATGNIGDLACIEGGIFDPFQSKNVIIRGNGEPVLVDVDMGKIQSSMLLGKTWNRFITNGVKRGFKELRQVS